MAGNGLSSPSFICMGKVVLVRDAPQARFHAVGFAIRVEVGERECWPAAGNG